MQLSLHSDYACRVLIYLAATKNERADISTIAESFGISENHLVKVVHKLGKLGFLSTTRGRGGGIELKRATSEIKIGDVVRKMESNFTIVECFSPETNTCPLVPLCQLKGILAQARDAFLSTLDKVSLADITTNQQALRQVMLSIKDPQ